jgi:hypothetical protein
MKFGFYLVDNGVITPEEFIEALKLHFASRPTIEQVVKRRSRPTMKQVVASLAEQCIQVLEEARHATPLTEILVERNVLTREELDRQHRAFTAIEEESCFPEMAEI